MIKTVVLIKFLLIDSMVSKSGIFREWSEELSVRCRVPSIIRSMEATVQSMAAARTADLAVRRAVADGESG